MNVQFHQTFDGLTETRPTCINCHHYIEDHAEPQPRVFAAKDGKTLALRPRELHASKPVVSRLAWGTMPKKPVPVQPAAVKVWKKANHADPGTEKTEKAKDIRDFI